jgi:Fe-S-cluster containining protein
LFRFFPENRMGIGNNFSDSHNARIVQWCLSTDLFMEETPWYVISFRGIVKVSAPLLLGQEAVPACFSVFFCVGCTPNYWRNSKASMINKVLFQAGLDLLHKPVLPLVGIVQFLYLTGDFATVEEIIAQLPETIETSYATYEDAAAYLAPYAGLMRPFVDLKAGKNPAQQVVTSEGEPVDAMTAVTALVSQQILTQELEQINSLLCAPCQCTLCCVGPDAAMAQAYFEIPLQPGETDFFPLERIDSTESRAHRIDDEPPLQVAGYDFFNRPDPVLIHWQRGWSLILPRESKCPNLEALGRCRVYPDRPLVCRRPQIFPYMLEPVAQEGQLVFRLRQSLLAVVDCPYVRLLQDEIAAYGAACELEMIFRHNKA